MPRPALVHQPQDHTAPLARRGAAPALVRDSGALRLAGGLDQCCAQVDAVDADAAGWTGFMRQTAMRAGMSAAARLRHRRA
jgi:hypothetical protein